MCNVCVLNVFSGPVSKCLTPQIASFTPIDFARRTATQFTFTITERATPHGGFPALNPLIGTDTLIVLFIILMFYGL